MCICRCGLAVAWALRLVGSLLCASIVVACGVVYPMLSLKLMVVGERIFSSSGMEVWVGMGVLRVFMGPSWQRK